MYRLVLAAGRRHPRAVDAGLAALVALVNVPVLLNGRAGVAGWGWLCAICLPLVWRRHAPVLVLCLVVGLGLVFYAVGGEGAYSVVAILVAAYTVARRRSWRYLLAPVVAMEAVLLYGLLVHGMRPDEWLAFTCAIGAAILLGVTVRTRQGYLSGLEERAERLEWERDQQARLAVATERARIAREVHDIVAHNVAVMVTLSDGAAYTATLDPERAGQTMEKVSATGREALAEMRRLLGLLRDGGRRRDGGSGIGGGTSLGGDAGDLVPPPGLDDVDRLLEQVRAAGVRVTLIREGVPGDWGPGAGLTVYRIVQEALTNTIKHAGPHTTAVIRLTCTAAGTDLEIIDEGPAGGAARRLPGDGHGLVGMAERAASYGGRLEAGPRPGGGWRVRTSLRFGEGEAA